VGKGRGDALRRGLGGEKLAVRTVEPETEGARRALKRPEVALKTKKTKEELKEIESRSL